MDSQFPLQELPPKIFINDEEFIDDEYIDNDDIVRGDRDSTLQTDQGSAASLKSISTVSSGSFRLAGGRLGTLATRLERAITRWARKNWADSSSSLASTDSTETSRSSFRTTNKSKKSSRRKRRPPSLADNQQREQSLRAVEARIRARGIGRIVPREFNLYSPPSSSSPSSQDMGLIEEEQEQRFIRTFSLDVMLPHLEHIRRKPGKPRRLRRRSRTTPSELDHFRLPRSLDPRRGHSAKPEPPNAIRTNALEDPLLKVEKGKGKDMIPSTIPPPNPPQTASTSRRDSVEGKPPQAWWLDVASPTWEDMRTLGKLLHLHPLTLEDILHRESREKLELFPKLGYSFIVFRAIESSTQNERLDVISQRTSSSQLPFQSVASEICIYLVVFRDGICTFHFSNISEHLDRVRGKLQTAAQATRRSSAWIAHGILDSVVDSFFPLVEEIGEHVTAIESLVSNEDSPASTITANPPIESRWLPAPSVTEKVAPISFVDEKKGFTRDVASVKTAKTQFSLPKLTCGLMWRRLRRALLQLIGFCMRSKPRKAKPSFTGTSLGLHRMARSRRLATSVTRILATKPEVVAGIRKRLLASDGLVPSDHAEVAIYFGDVQDHILTLQQSLVHYERMLSESHPMYLQNLRIDLIRARAKSDFAAFVLAIVTVVIVPPSVIIGMVSMNVTLPRDNTGFRIFGAVIVIILCTQAFFLGLVRYWWVKAGRIRGSLQE